MLGVVSTDDEEFVLADIPGLIEGAHAGAGLGDRFLGHVERCRILLHLVDGTVADVADTWRAVRGELEAYGHGLADKPELIAVNKIDALSAEQIEAQRKALEAVSGRPVLTLSGATGRGVKETLRALLIEIERGRATAA